MAYDSKDKILLMSSSCLQASML